MEDKEDRVPDEETVIKMSKCSKCDGIIRVGVEHCMDKQQLKEFGLEAVEHNLSISSMPLLDYRARPPHWCYCKKEE